MYHVYILQCSDKSLYTGITNNLRRRLEQHRNGTGGNYTRSRGVEKIVYREAARGRGAALRREAEIKRWPRGKKIDLIRRGAQ
ncbi:GIY-YIG nuclease family protein [Candidatus Kaiserbacteria bacterium]|nr:GIY-YIG nuclease family protein [Candidatus Kaiserbacteria bacterium]